MMRTPSPKRLVRAVFIPAAQEAVFWKKITKKKEVTPRPSHPIKIVNNLPPKIRHSIDDTNLNVTKRNRKVNFSSLI